MKKAIVLFLALFIAVCVWIEVCYSRNEIPQMHSQKSPVMMEALPNTQNRAHTANNLWLCVSNWGFLGSQMGDIEHLPSCRFPGGSKLEYLFQGGIWIGAVVNDTPYVSVGCDGWQWVYELWPDSGTTGAIVENEWWGDQEFIAVYFDTSSDNWLSPSQDPWDNGHHPMDVRITQHSYVWETQGYYDFVIFDFIIKNIGTKLLSEPYIGFYMDTDIMHIDENPYGEHGAQDDVTGFLRVYQGDTVNIAWAADNDGHGIGGEHVFVPGISPTGVVGMRLLGASTPSLKLSYNWYLSNQGGLPKDWGPWKQANQGIWSQENCYAPGDSFFPDHVLGTPGGDCSKYFLMSNGEVDYDQIYSCVWPSQHPSEGWLPPSSECADFANGYDTRFLFSFGPFNQLAPGESLHFAVVWVAGDSFHVDPLNLIHDPNMTHPDTFYSHLNFSKLVENSETALSVYQSGYTSAPPGPPKNLKLVFSTDSTVTLSWSPKVYHSLLGYNLYRSTVPGVHNDPPINSSVITDTVFQDTGLHATEIYYYAVSSVNTSYSEGGLSPDFEVTVGRPFPPSGLTAKGQKDMVTLSWQHNPEDDVIGYKIYRAEVCSSYAFPSTEECYITLDSIGWQNVFWDHSVNNGHIYYYRITAVDSTGLESFACDTVHALPMAFDQGIVVLDLTNAETYWEDFQYGDSVDAFYNRALQSYDFAYIHHDSCGYHYFSHRVSLPELSPYQVCILHGEDLSNRCGLFNDSCEAILRHYLRTGGKLIIEGRAGLLGGLGITCGYHELSPTPIHWLYEFEYDWFRWDAVYNSCFTPMDTNWEFVGAKSELAEYPNLAIDTSRVNRSIDPSHHIPLHGKLPGIGYIIPRDWREAIYTFHSAYSDTSSLEGMPVAIRHFGSDHQVIFFGFPLYFIQEDQATELLHQALADLGMYPSSVTNEEVQENIPTSFSLKQNYPNPFNPETIIEYELPQACEVEITIYNILGEKVRTLVKEIQKPGQQRVRWDGRNEKGKDVSSGIYLYRIRTLEFSQTKKMVLLR